MSLFSGRCRVCKVSIFSPHGVPAICSDHLKQVREADAKGPDAVLAVFVEWEERYGYQAMQGDAL